MIEKRVCKRQGGVTRVCADDVGAALRSIKELKIYYNVFRLSELLAGLTLKPSKCVLVPLWANFSKAVGETIRKWLEDNLPQWKDFKILPCTKYLGFMMGLAAGSSQWKHAADKWQTRALSIAHSGATPAISALLYNSRALPTLGYISQLCTLPKNFRRKEVGIANSIMHLPASTLSASTAFTWSSGGAPKILSGVVMNHAILLRTALQTVPNCGRWYGRP